MKSFSSDDLAVYLYGQEYLDRMARILAIIEQEEAFSKHAIFYQGRSEKFRHGLRKVRGPSSRTVRASYRVPP